jgi:hypothetical protein
VSLRQTFSPSTQTRTLIPVLSVDDARHGGVKVASNNLGGGNAFIPCLLYWPHQQQTCWRRTALHGNDTVLVDEDLYTVLAHPNNSSLYSAPLLSKHVLAGYSPHRLVYLGTCPSSLPSACWCCPAPHTVQSTVQGSACPGSSQWNGQAGAPLHHEVQLNSGMGSEIAGHTQKALLTVCKFSSVFVDHYYWHCTKPSRLVQWQCSRLVFGRHQACISADIFTCPGGLHLTQLWTFSEVEVTLRLTVSQYVLVTGTPLGPMTRFYFFLRGRVCNL